MHERSPGPDGDVKTLVGIPNVHKIERSQGWKDRDA